MEKDKIIGFHFDYDEDGYCEFYYLKNEITGLRLGKSDKSWKLVLFTKNNEPIQFIFEKKEAALKVNKIIISQLSGN